jgi:hypothetical protein
MDARGRAWLLAAAGLLAPVGATAQRALQQLEQVCRDSTGADCRVNVPAVPQPSPVQGGQGVQQGEAVRSTRPNQATTHRQVTQPQARPAAPRAPPPKTTEQVVREQLAAGLAQAFLSVLLAPPDSTPQAPQGPTPEELAERERRRVEELQRRAALVAEQRASRDAQQTSNMESMASAFGAGFDRPAEPGGGDPVRLAGTTPSLFAPPVYRSPAQAAPLSPAVTRLAALAAENEDVAALQVRFADLSGRLDEALAEADAIGRMGRNRVQEYERMERTVADGVADAWDRGMSLAVDGLLLGHAKAIARVEEVRSNARAWTTLKSMLHDAQRGAELAEGVNERIEQVEQARADAAFLTRQRAFKEDVAYLAERFGGPYAEQGKSILASAKTVRDELEVLHRQRELEGFERRYEERRVRVDKELRALVAEVKRTRRELAALTGLDEQAIPRPRTPAPPGSFGTKPPPVPVE